MHGAPFCISHNPDAADVKAKGSRKGGRNRRALEKVQRPSQKVLIENLADVQRLLLTTLAEVRNGTLDPSVGRTVGYLSVVAVQVTEAVELDRRVTQMEEHILALHNRMNHNFVDTRVAG